MSPKTHLTDYVDVKTGKDLRPFEGVCYLMHEAYIEIDGRLSVGGSKNRVLTWLLNQSAKSGCSIGWDSPRFEDPDIRLRTITNHRVWCLRAEDRRWVEFWTNRNTLDTHQEEGDPDVVKMIGQCYNTLEKSKGQV